MNDKIYAMLDTVRNAASEAGETISSAAYLAGKKGGEVISGVKLALRVRELEGSVEDALRDVGTMVYATHTGGADNSAALLEKLGEIDDLRARIAELEIRMGRASVVRICPVCGAEYKEGDAYCRECGGKL